MGLGQTLGLGFLFTSRDLSVGSTARGIERSFDSLDRKVTGVTSHIRDAFGGMRGKFAAVAGGAIASFGLAGAIKDAGEFEMSVAQLGVIADATGPKLDRLKNAAIDVGLSTQFTPTEASAVLKDFASASYSAEESLKMLNPALNMAAASFGKLSAADSVSLARQTMRQFGIEADQAALTMDKLVQAANVLPFDIDELPLAMSIAPRGANAISQSFEETLIAVGMAKGVISGTERAATAVATAMERIGNPKAQKQLEKYVKLFEGNDQFRDVLDIVVDLIPALDGMTEKMRAAFLEETFGAEAKPGIQAMIGGIKLGIETANGVRVRGAEAVAYLRKQMEEAAGASARAVEKMLDTFPGQMLLVKSSLTVLREQIGEPFIQVLKPVVRAAVGAIRGLAQAIREMPGPLKKVLAGVVIGSIAFGAFATAVVALKAAMVLVPVVFKLAMVSVKGFVASLWPVALVVGAVAAIVAAFVVAYRRNFGGIADATQALFQKISLFYNAMKQVFSEGGFSGAVREELNKAENSGLKKFVIALYRIAYRVQRFGEGIRDGFVAAVEAARPVFEDLRAAVSHLYDELSKLFGGMSEGAAGIPSQRFADFGKLIGKVIGTVVSAYVWLLTRIMWVYAGIVGGLRAASKWIGDAFAFIKSAVGDLVETWDKLWGSSEESTESVGKASSFWRTLGEVIGWLVGGALALLGYALGMVIKLIDWLIQAIQWLGGKFVELDAKLAPIRKHLLKWFTEEIPETFGKALSTVGSYFEVIGNFIAGIIGWVQGKIEALVAWLTKVSETVAGIVDAVDRGAGAVKNFAGGTVKSVTDFLGFGDDDEAAKPASPTSAGTDDKSSKAPTPEAFIRALPDLSVLRAGALRNVPTPLDFIKALPDPRMFRSAKDARSSLMADGLPGTAQADAQIRAIRDLAAMGLPKVRTASELAQTLQIAVQVDGETIARAVHRANEDARARGFSPNTVPNF
jgi:TP901 family phage tail tape measure protein